MLLAAKRPLRDRRRQRLGRRGVRSAAALRRELAAAGGLRLPLPGHVRQPPSALRRRRRHRHQPQARRARARGRPGPRDRRAPGRDDDRRLHAAAGAPAGAEAGAHARRAPRSWAASTQADLLLQASMSCAAKALETLAAPTDVPWGEWTAGAHADYEANLMPTPVSPLDMAQVMKTVQRAGAGRHRVHQRRRQLRRLAASLLAVPRACSTTGARSSRRPRARWATACRRRSPRRCCIPIARWSTSPATATS